MIAGSAVVSRIARAAPAPLVRWLRGHPDALPNAVYRVVPTTERGQDIADATDAVLATIATLQRHVEKGGRYAESAREMLRPWADLQVRQLAQSEIEDAARADSQELPMGGADGTAGSAWRSAFVKGYLAWRRGQPRPQGGAEARGWLHALATEDATAVARVVRAATVPTDRGDVVDEEPADEERAYFVTARDRGGRYAALLGPFHLHRAALEHVDLGRSLAHEQYPRDLDFGDVAFGTAKMPRNTPVMLVDTSGLPRWVTADVLRGARAMETYTYGDKAYHDGAEAVAKGVEAEIRTYATVPKAGIVFHLFEELRPFRSVAGISRIIDDLSDRRVTYEKMAKDAEKRNKAKEKRTLTPAAAQAAAMRLGDARTADIVGPGGLSGASPARLRALVKAAADLDVPAWKKEKWTAAERKRIHEAGEAAIKAHRTGHSFRMMGGLHTLGMGGLAAIRERGRAAMAEELRRERRGDWT